MQLSNWMNRLCGRLGRIQMVSHGYRFRCPYCGDSQKRKSKARGHVVEKWDKRFFKCHNCGLSKSFDQFLKHMDADLYAEYVNQECSKRHLEGAPAPLKEEEGVNLAGTQCLPRGGCSDHQSWRRPGRSMPAYNNQTYSSWSSSSTPPPGNERRSSPFEKRKYCLLVISASSYR